MTEKKQLKAALEALLFAAGYAVPYGKLAAALTAQDRPVTEDEVRETVLGMAQEINRDEGRGVMLVLMPDACQLCTREEHISAIRELLGVKRGGTLSRSASESLAIIAYHQPVTRAYVDSIRGIDSSHAVAGLLDKKLIEVCGRLDAPGRPSLYRTTDEFLRVFGLDSLESLPPAELFGEVQPVSEESGGK